MLCYDSYGLFVLLHYRSNILHWSRWILVENVRFICWHNWLSRYCAHGNDGCDLRIWTRKVCWSALCDIRHYFGFIANSNLWFLRNFRFSDDIYQMTGYHPGIYWQWTWRYIGPFIMSIIFVSSVVCLIVETPTYNAYKPEEVIFSFFVIFKRTNQFNRNLLIHSLYTVDNCENRISRLGHVDRISDDCCWSTTNANCLFVATLPNTQSRFRYSSRIDPKEWDHRFNKTNDGRWWCKYKYFICVYKTTYTHYHRVNLHISTVHLC